MVRLATFKFQCLHCRRDSVEFFNEELMDAIRALESLYGWIMTQQEDEFYMRCPECTAEIDAVQEERMKD